MVLFLLFKFLFIEYTVILHFIEPLAVLDPQSTLKVHSINRSKYHRNKPIRCLYIRI